MLAVANDQKRLPVECLVRVDGEEISELYPYLTEVSVECHRLLLREPKARLTFESRRDERGRWTVQDAGLLRPWREISIEALFGDSGEEVMRGYIRKVDAAYPDDPGAAGVTVECRDESLSLDREHVRKVWGAKVPVDDGTIARQIVGRHGLLLDPESGAGQAGLVLNQDTTDARFLCRRAQANGYELIFRAGRVYFGPPRLGARAQPAIRIYAGTDTNCLSMSIKADGHQPDIVGFDLAPVTGAKPLERKVKSNLPLLGTSPADSSSSGLADFTWRMKRRGAYSEAELNALAQAKANELAMKVRASGELDGSLYGHVLRVGEPVGVDGAGDSMGGVYYVDSVSHRFSSDGYRQSVSLLRNAFGDNLTTGTGVLGAVL